MDAVAAGIEDHKTDTGRMKISCVELTMLDLLRYPHAGGGLDHIVTVLSDLAERVDAKKLATLSGAFERSVAQRLGHLLCRLGYEGSTITLHDAVHQGPDLPWAEQRMFAKLANPGFLADIRPLLAPDEADRLSNETMRSVFATVRSSFITHIPGHPWARTLEMCKRYDVLL